MKIKTLVSICVVIAICVIMTAHVYAMNGNSLDLSDTDMYLIVTDSMDGEPTDYHISTIERDSLILTHSISSEDIAIGDVIGYRTPMSDRLVFHRVVYMDGDGIVLKGDAYEFIDTINKDQAECIVVSADPVLGKIANIIRLDYIPMIGLMIVFAGLCHFMKKNKGDNNEIVEGKIRN